MFANIYCTRVLWQTVCLIGILLTFVDKSIGVGDNRRSVEYTRTSLLDIRDLVNGKGVSHLDYADFPPDLLWNNTSKPNKRRKRGKKSGIKHRCSKRQSSKINRAPLPSLMFGNVRSINSKHKVDELQANVNWLYEYRESSLICITESWLKEDQPDPSIDNFSTIRSDRIITPDSQKKQGGGVCLFVNDKWCKNSCVKEKYCDEHIEFLTVSLRPFYLPREFNNIYVTLVYIPPSANYNLASDKLVESINNIENNSPDAVKIVLGDFNQCKFIEHIPHYHQYVQCPTRGENTLDLLFSNVKDCYKVKSKPPLGDSDHLMLHCIPKYKPKYKDQKPISITVSQWNEDSINNLRGCFDCTDWDTLFNDAESIETNADVISEYIKFCVDMNIPTKQVKCFANNKPWVKKELKELLNEKKAAISSKDQTKLKEVQSKLRQKIKESKEQYAKKIEDFFSSNDSKKAWQGMKTLTGMKKTSKLPDVDDEYIFAEDLNKFYCRFDDKDFSYERELIAKSLEEQHDERIIITIKEVNSVLSKINPRKASGPDGVAGKVLKECRIQLSHILQQLFQLSVDTHQIPLNWLTAELIPVMKPNVSLGNWVKNDLRPVALTAIIMKSLERIVLRHLNPEKLIDSSQFAYIKDRSVEDASLILQHNIQAHLDHPRTYVRVMFIDFSSAFNTIQPHILLEKLKNLNVNSNLLLWIQSFLTNRKQYVRFNDKISSMLSNNTGAPQGCVLSAGLFILYTSDKCATEDNCFILKYADDTVIVGLLDDNPENERKYRQEIDSYVQWCKENYLNLNVKKTKEVIIDFRQKKNDITPIQIEGECVEIVENYKYLGTIFDNKLKGSDHVSKIAKKANQRLYFVRKLKKIGVNRKVLTMFYRSVVESILSFNIVSWYGNCASKDRKKLKKVIKSAKKLGCDGLLLDKLYKAAVTNKCTKIMKDSSHPLHKYFKFLKSGTRLDNLFARTSRFRDSFVPSAIRHFNGCSI